MIKQNYLIPCKKTTTGENRQYKKTFWKLYISDNYAKFDNFPIISDKLRYHDLHTDFFLIDYVRLVPDDAQLSNFDLYFMIFLARFLCARPSCL